jgi:4-aminobutyrate aminotransferase-like enzyme
MEFQNTKSSQGYDFSAEKLRYNFLDITYQGITINRGKCDVSRQEQSELGYVVEQKEQIYEQLFPNTLSKKAPIIDIALPYTGHYYCSYDGVYFDAAIGVGMKLIDDQHPNIKNMIRVLLQSNAIIRRESVTNDIMVVNPESYIKTPQDVSSLVNGLANKAFPHFAPYKAYLSSSGAEAIEAALKIACRATHFKLIKIYGYDFESKIMNDLGIALNQELSHPIDKEPLYVNYPYYFIAMKGAFHGRTLGALSLTNIRPVHKRGYPASLNVKYISFNGDDDELIHIIDFRTLKEIYDTGEKIVDIIAGGKIPKELIAGVIFEVYQGEAGYNIADKKWVSSISKICRDNEITLIADEVQSFARTGKVFALEHYDCEPDIIAISKASVIGITISSAKFTDALPKGWHSSTWGGGKVFDNNLAWTVIDTYLNYHDSIFKNNTYIENQQIKSEYIDKMFQWIAERHPKTFVKYSGLGGMWGFTVYHRDELGTIALKNGLKLLSCGITKEPSPFRVLFLSDVLTREIDSFAVLLDKSLTCLDNIYN